ncbi:MAG: hypothetical protein ACHQF0_00905 [Chitinophagales bacterium]
MEWLSINDDPRQRIYELWTNKEKSLILAYHPTSRTIRISTGDERRVFLIGREGFRRNRTVLRNEYGIRIGQLSHDSGQVNQGNIEVSGEQYNYILQDVIPARAAIYKNGDMLAECELPEVSKNAKGSDHDLLILTLCWYLDVAVKKEEEEYA